MTGHAQPLPEVAQPQRPQDLRCDRNPGPGGSGVGIALSLIAFYKSYISHALPRACRFHPSCSSYAADAIRKYGVLRGLGKAAVRLGKCHPFHPGGFDPVE